MDADRDKVDVFVLMPVYETLHKGIRFLRTGKSRFCA